MRDFFESGGGGEGAAATAPVASATAMAAGDDPFKVDMPAEVLFRMNADKTVAIITLNRPDQKNAINDGITFGISLGLKRIKATPSMRVCFITGNGNMFCAGGDPKNFQAAQEQGKKAAAEAAAAKAAGKVLEDVVDENAAGANVFAQFLDDLDQLPVYTVALANGSAMGGGFGLLCCCDCVIAKKTAFFALSEVKLGVIPATISPYVLAKIGPSNARRLFMTGETITGEKAISLGLVQEVVGTNEELMQKAQAICDVMTLAAPGAVAASKSLVRNVQYKPITPELMQYTADQLTKVRMSEESTGGMAAVQAGKKAPWAQAPVKLPTA